MVRNRKEAELLARYIRKELSDEQFEIDFANKYSSGFLASRDLQKIGVVNQTTMLASETQEITDLLRQAMITRYGENDIKNHIADTRDTLCYATNDNQSATYGLMEHDADFAIVVGGYNSSNTTHLVELLEQKFSCYFIQSEEAILSKESLISYDIHEKKEKTIQDYFPQNKEKIKIILTSGASCPDSVVDAVIQKLIRINNIEVDIEKAIELIQ